MAGRCTVTRRPDLGPGAALCSFPLDCGTCERANGFSAINPFPAMRWCGACGEGICPTCFPRSQEHVYPHRCQRCLDVDAETGAMRGGRELRQREEERVLRLLKGTT